MKFSIVTITFNSENYLKDTIDSVLGQDYSDFEYLIVDGGSTDGTLDIIAEYARADSRIKVVSEPDKGIADAMNKGIRMAKGEIIAHLHSDDYYPDSTVLSSVANVFENSRPCWVTGGMYIVGSDGERLTEIKVRTYSYQKLVSGNTLLHPSTFIAREAFDKAGVFDISLRHAMDYHLWLRLGKLADPVTIDKPLSCFRAHAGSLSTFEAEQATKEEWMIRKHFLGRQYHRIAYHYCRYLRSKKGNARFFDKLLNKGNLHGDKQ